MPHYQQTPRKQSKAQLWAKRSVHLKTYLQDLPRRLRLDIEALVKIFLTRRSLLLKLADNYLIKLWECSRATAQRRLEYLEQLGLLKRMTQPPKKQADGSWKQDRKLVLILPKKTNSLLVSHFGAQANSQQNAERSSLTVPVKIDPPMHFVDWLATQNRVSKGAFAFWMRRWGAKPRSMGYLLDNIHSLIERRPDTLESILWDAEAQKLSGPALVGFVVSEIKIRIPA
ncbi:MAG: hypothetical protein VXY89_13525 [SAR324 cluster bacterium]|nr:hypothetical protein [SAR324 cluster bacterium]